MLPSLYHLASLLVYYQQSLAVVMQQALTVVNQPIPVVPEFYRREKSRPKNNETREISGQEF